VSDAVEGYSYGSTSRRILRTDREATRSWSVPGRTLPLDKSAPFVIAQHLTGRR